jgi:methionyl-tRNA formyltransferase
MINLDKVLFIAGYTARSKAYAQAMFRKGYKPELTIIYGTPKVKRPGQEHEIVNSGQQSKIPLFLPNLEQSLDDTIIDAGWSYNKIDVNSINDELIVNALNEFNPEFVIFSGYGSEIVSSEVLGCANFLHIHAGYLPDYRGSTTGYYSWINERTIGASAILLNEIIDAGPILMRQQYSTPPPDVNMDFLYEPAIRADLLIKILVYWLDVGDLPMPLTPNRSGQTYYVIHPILKHLPLIQQSKQLES